MPTGCGTCATWTVSQLHAEPGQKHMEVVSFSLPVHTLSTRYT